MIKPPPTWEEMEKHKVPVKSDAGWQRVLRLRQAMWREKQGLPIGRTGSLEGEPGPELGSRIAMPDAKRDRSNFLTATIGEVVRSVMEEEQANPKGKLIKEPRIHEDLLSSQPLAFNLFGELKADLGAATAWARYLWPNRVDAVTSLEFEHSPGRRDTRYLGNRTAFDVYLEHTVPGGGEGFIGIEVKYHEDLQEPPAETRDRVLEVARLSGVFSDTSIGLLSKPPLQQVWFDHLLALAMLQADKTRWNGNGMFVFLHPVENSACYRVVSEYQGHLASQQTFQRLTLEEAVAVLRQTSGAPWVEEFQKRYLGQ